MAFVVSLNQPKSNLYTGISDTPKGAPRKASAINRLARTDGFVVFPVRGHQTAKKHRTFPVLFAGDPYGTRTHVTTVKGWCLNRLTNGP